MCANNLKFLNLINISKIIFWHTIFVIIGVQMHIDIHEVKCFFAETFLAKAIKVCLLSANHKKKVFFYNIEVLKNEI